MLFLWAGFREGFKKVSLNQFSLSVTAFVLITFFAGPTICSFAYSASLYECFDDGRGSLNADWSVTVGTCTQVPLNVSDWVGPDGRGWQMTPSEEYSALKMLSYTALFAYGLATPIIYFVLLFFKRDKLLHPDTQSVETEEEEDEVLEVLETLYEGFQPKYFWWEVQPLIVSRLGCFHHQPV